MKTPSAGLLCCGRPASTTLIARQPPILSRHPRRFCLRTAQTTCQITTAFTSPATLASSSVIVGARPISLGPEAFILKTSQFPQAVPSLAAILEEFQTSMSTAPSASDDGKIAMKSTIPPCHVSMQTSVLSPSRRAILGHPAARAWSSTALPIRSCLPMGCHNLSNLKMISAVLDTRLQARQLPALSKMCQALLQL